jgi:hypothetical protein
MSIVGEILVQLLGDVAGGALSRNRPACDPFPEGEGNASLGAVALFFGGLALVFSGLFFVSTLDPASFSDVGGPAILGIAAGTFLVALLAYRAGRKAPKVTRRSLRSALVGRWLALPAMVLAMATLGLCVARLLHWVG